MSKRERILKTIPLKDDPEGRNLEISLSYSLGGMNYFTNNPEPRGYYLHVTPIARINGFVSFTAFSGFKVLVEAAERFTQNKLDSLTVPDEMIQRLVMKVCVKNGFSLEEAVV
jgi:hypothetical protein